MTPPPFAPSAPSDGSAVGALRAYGRRLLRIASTSVWHALLVALFLWLVTAARIYAVIDPELQFFRVLVPVIAIQELISVLLLYLGLIAARALGLQGVGNILVLFIGVVVGVALQFVPPFDFDGYPWDAAVRWHIVDSEAAFDLDGIWSTLAVGLLLSIYYATRDAETRSARASRAAEVERAVAQRAVIESGLKVLQARVEPEFLFEALAEARRLYSVSPAVADQLLDDLITYLRAALPQMREGGSTVGREVALAAAYLAVTPAVRARHGKATTTLVAHADDDVAGFPLPPMVLLPVAQVATAGEPTSIQVVASRDDAAVRITFRLEGASAGPAPDTRLAGPRATLAQFCGDRARIVTRVENTASVIEILVPATDPDAADTDSERSVPANG